MEFISPKTALIVMIVVLVFIAAFCYDLGCSANTIRPGTGNGMLNIAAASGLLTVLTGINLTLLYKNRKSKRKK